MLLLKRHLIALVRAGKKRQTIRFWPRPMVHAGQLAYTPGLGRVLITAVDELPSLALLTAADARADGFATRKALRAEIGRIYGPGVPAGKRLYRVKFAWPAAARAAGVKRQVHRKPSRKAANARRRELAEFLRAPRTMARRSDERAG